MCGVGVGCCVWRRSEVVLIPVRGRRRESEVRRRDTHDIDLNRGGWRMDKGQDGKVFYDQ
jgi:hypothetical protein